MYKYRLFWLNKRQDSLYFCVVGQSLLLNTADKMRLAYYGSTGYFNATISETGMLEATLFDAYLSLVQDGVNSTDAAEIIVFLLENEMYVNYLGHIVRI